MTQDVAPSQSATAHAVQPSVNGKFIADLARTLVVEGEWQKALQLLTESFEGLNHEHAVSILKGERDLHGCSRSGVGLVQLGSDSVEFREMAERLDQLYGSVFKHNGKHWKPYLRVVNWARPDYEFSRTYGLHANLLDTTTRSNSVLYRPELAYRSLYYAQDPHRDLLVIVQVGKVEYLEILCEHTEMPPLWYRVPATDIQAHLASRYKAGKLDVDEDGHAFRTRLAATCHSRPAEEAPLPGEARRDELKATIAMEDAQADRESTPEDDDKSEVLRVLQEAERLVAEFQALSLSADTPEALGTASREFDRAMTCLEEQVTDASLDDLNERRHQLFEAAHQRRVGMLAVRVREQARTHGGFFRLKLDVPPGHSAPRYVEIPKTPFLLWALRGFRFEEFNKQRPEWPLVAGSGLKMLLDNPFHTDWMLGAGLNIDKTYDRVSDDGAPSLEKLVSDAAYEERSRLVEEWTGVPFVTLAKTSDRTYFYGKVVHAKPDEGVPPGCIAIAATAGPEFQLAMEAACAEGSNGRGILICETGGKLAHLAIVAREMGCTVLMVPNALNLYREGQRLSVDLEAGTIRLLL